ncbi:transcription factor bHLH118-like [Vigna umbellata]|uniref:transcription factor bHLH118-like n=1 Tax=Vigna umbellata TaxID=87088 RepID=UPI001F5F2B09|nr:transcription factor bHLH118-like [Vigna umbellata]
MFPLQRGNELVIQFSNVLQPQHKISKDLILDDHNSDNSPLVAYSDKKVRTSPPNKLFYAPETSHANSAEEEYAKKMVHREIERQRRQEMATLHASLRSLLPLPFIKGKRSMSDQMNEAVNYINHLQKNIKELSEKRDKLKKKVAINSSLESRENKHESCGFTVRQTSSGAVGIEFSGLSEEGVSLSKLLELLLEEGLEVVCCLSTKVNGRLLHSLQCEVVNSDTVDLSELRRKFSNVVPSFRVSE